MVTADMVVPDWDAIRKEIAAVLYNEDYVDKSYGPIVVRLAWHTSGTYDKNTKTGGSNGARMRFAKEGGWGANAGLRVARDVLEPIKARHPEITYSDLWTFAGTVAVHELGGPVIPWRPGRKDAVDGKETVPDGRLPDAAQGARHVRDIFYRMGFDDREITALIGAHSLGKTHRNRSGFEGPWTRTPTQFSNDFYKELLGNTWTIKKWDGPEQFEDKTGELMMLPADMAFLFDPEFKQYVEMYANDQDMFFKDFAAAYSKLLELGVDFGDDSKN